MVSHNDCFGSSEMTAGTPRVVLQASSDNEYLQDYRDA